MSTVATEYKSQNGMQVAVSARANDNQAQEQEVVIPEFTISAETQGALDRILEFLNKSSYMPRFEAKGALIPLCLSLNEQIMELMPDEMHADARALVEYITNSLCDYADASGLSGFELVMEFKK